MDTPRENTLSMYVTVEDVLNRNQSSWQIVPAILTAFTELKARIEAIREYAVAHKSSTKGVTALKRSTRTAMVDATIEVAGAVRAFASANDDHVLLAKVDVQRSDFNRARDTEVAGLCQDIYVTASAIVEMLDKQGVSADDLKAFQEKIEAYNPSVGKPRGALSSNRAAGTLMDTEFEAADKLLEDQLDALMVKFKSTQPSFFQEYVAARRTVANPTGRNGKNGSNGHDTPPPTPQ